MQKQEKPEQPEKNTKPHPIVKMAYRMAHIFVRLFAPYLRTSVIAELVTQAGVEVAHKQHLKKKSNQKDRFKQIKPDANLSEQVCKSYIRVAIDA